MAWSFDVFGTHSGAPLGKIPVKSFSLACSLNQGEGGTIDVITGHPGWAGTDWDTLLMETRRTVVVSYNGVPQFAGLVWEWEKEYGSAVRSYVLKDVWSVINGRHMIDWNASKPAESVLEWGPSSLATIAGRVVEHSTSSSTYLDDLPMTYPGFTAGATTVRYLGYNASNVGESLQRIISWQTGPDVWFRPIISSSGQFSWDMMADPNLYKSLIWEVNLDSDSAKLKRKRSAVNLANRAYVFGEGTGKATPAAKASQTTDYIVMERVSKDHKTRALPPLQNYANRIVGQFSSPVDTYSLQVPLSFLEYLRPGMTLRINGVSDPDFPDELIRRVAGYSWTQDGPVQVTLF